MGKTKKNSKNKLYTDLLVKYQTTKSNKDLSELYLAIRQPVLNLIIKKVPYHIKGDVLHEVFEKIIANIDKYDPNKAPALTWMWRISHSICAGYHYIQGRQPKGVDSYESFDTIDESLTAEQVKKRDEAVFLLFGDVMKIVELLPEEEQGFFKDKFIKGLTYKQISENRKIKPSSARNRVIKVKNKVKGMIAEDKILNYYERD